MSWPWHTGNNNLVLWHGISVVVCSLVALLDIPMVCLTKTSPIIGILKQPIVASSHTMFAALYIKWLEAGGDQSIPIAYDASLKWISPRLVCPSQERHLLSLRSQCVTSIRHLHVPLETLASYLQQFWLYSTLGNLFGVLLAALNKGTFLTWWQVCNYVYLSVYLSWTWDLSYQILRKCHFMMLCSYMYAQITMATQPKPIHF